MEQKNYPRFRFSVDRGGTFTDFIAHIQSADGSVTEQTCKLLSCDPNHYLDAPSEGIRRVMRQHIPDIVAETGPINTDHLEEVRMGTTVATNALLEHKGERSVIVLTEGFADTLDIRDQARPKIFALEIIKTKALPEQVVEAFERVRPVSLREQEEHGDDWPSTWVRKSDCFVMDVVQPLDVNDIRTKLQKSYDAGLRSVAICLLHAYAFADHEAQVRAVAEEIGFSHISSSSELMAQVKYVPRAITASVDAYLSPLILRYVQSFRSCFENDIAGVRLYFIQSDGGLTSSETFCGYRAVLSGPAGGVVGYARNCSADLGPNVQTVGFDMGGTSTDVSRSVGETITHTIESEIAGTSLQALQVQVHTVAAGGGSILRWANGMFQVGPESAGSHPGPACYGKGGPAAVTDANFVLGRLQVDHFPHTFGPNANEPLNKTAAISAMAALARTIEADTGQYMTPEAVAYAFVTIANESMCRPIRSVTEASGFRCSDHTLAVFGGAGGQHACAMARSLGMNRIYVHRDAAILSAVGASMTDVVEEAMRSVQLSVQQEGVEAILEQTLEDLTQTAVSQLSRLGFEANHIVVERYLGMQYEGTGSSLMITCDTEKTGNLLALCEAQFLLQYRQQFDFVLHRNIIIDGVRIRARGTQLPTQPRRALSHKGGEESTAIQPPYTAQLREQAVPVKTVACFLTTGFEEVPVYNVSTHHGPIVGPALLILQGTTVLLERDATAYTNDRGNLIIHTVHASEAFTPAMELLPLSIFSHRFMSIAEQMGMTLQRTSISTNIRERLDFSCALFDPDGNLVANAPHIPVHLGAMGAAVRWQRDYYKKDWHEGDVMLTNHPACGGSHLPDITVISAFFHDENVVFYVASRGHHADVGGTTPGSMPPFSKSLEEEGAAIKTIKLVEAGQFNEAGIRAALLAPGRIPGMSGCRTLEDSISDLRAKVAANNRGIQLIKGLIAEYGLDVVQAYMRHIQVTAEQAARGVLRTVAQRYGDRLSAEDAMDDGTPIKLTIAIDQESGEALFDFSGSGCQVLNSTNCPTAIVHSAIIYCIRCMVDSDIPLNQGCMKPITVKVEDSSILKPDDDLPVVAGNVTTSQRVTDVVLMALRAVACSHGCMNSFTLGNENFAYYETICGGSGAGPSFHGASAVHCHMTNTRLTDPEILELRYPVLLRHFAIRRGSGGEGRFQGGDGVRRSFLVLRDMTAVFLTERRVLSPKGLYNGSDGQRGLNMIYVPKKNLTTHDVSTLPCTNGMIHDAARGKWGNEENTPAHQGSGCCYHPRNIGGKNVVQVRMGDIISIHTAGGGGCYASP